MDPKALNALVHDREAAFYDDRFLIDFSRIGPLVRADLGRVLGGWPRARRALDVACGTGYLAVGIAAAGGAGEVHATDLSAAMLARTRENARRARVHAALALSDAEQLPYADDSFDLVVARGALHHCPDPLAALREIRRVLEPGGTALVLAEPTSAGERQVAAVVGLAVRAVEVVKRIARRAPDPERTGWELAAIASNLHTFDQAGLATLAEKAGFEDIAVGTASAAWILVLGVNYYLVGEVRLLARNRAFRAAARALAGAADRFDRVVSDRYLPADWRHTVQAVLR